MGQLFVFPLKRWQTGVRLKIGPIGELSYEVAAEVNRISSIISKII